MALHGRQMGPQLGCWPGSSIPLHIVSPWGLVGFLTVWWFQDSWTSKHGGWLSSKGKCGSFQAFLRSRPGTDSIISTTFCQLQQVTGPSRFKGRELIMVWILKYVVHWGPLKWQSITVYSPTPYGSLPPHMQKTVTTLRSPKSHPITAPELSLKSIISSYKSDPGMDEVSQVCSPGSDYLWTKETNYLLPTGNGKAERGKCQ